MRDAPAMLGTMKPETSRATPPFSCIALATRRKNTRAHGSSETADDTVHGQIPIFFVIHCFIGTFAHETQETQSTREERHADAHRSHAKSWFRP